MNRQHQIDRCRRQAIEMMNTRRGQEAAEGGYYSEMFDWLYRRLEQGTAPAGIPAKLLEEWQARGEWRKRPKRG